MDRESETHDLSTGEDQEIVFSAEHHENFDTDKAKSYVVLGAGLCACLTVSALAIMQGYSVMRGGPGIGVDLNHILIGYAAGLAMIYKWAFAKEGDK